MMANQKKDIVNLFDKTISSIQWNARLSLEGRAYLGDSYANITFISHPVYLESGKRYMLIRKLIDGKVSAYNRFCFYYKSGKMFKLVNSINETEVIEPPINCAYILFNGLIEDIDNIKFYELK